MSSLSRGAQIIPQELPDTSIWATPKAAMPRSQPPSLLVVLIGLAGSGKSHIANQLHQAMKTAKLLDFDCALAAHYGDTSLPLTHSDKYLAYRSMYDDASRELLLGTDVLWVQALTQERGHDSNPDPSARTGLRSLAQRTGANIVFVECIAPESVLKERLRIRNRSPMSETSWPSVLARMIRNWEPLEDPHLSIDTSIESALGAAFEYIESSRRHK